MLTGDGALRFAICHGSSGDGKTRGGKIGLPNAKPPATFNHIGTRRSTDFVRVAKTGKHGDTHHQHSIYLRRQCWQAATNIEKIIKLFYVLPWSSVVRSSMAPKEPEPSTIN